MGQREVKLPTKKLMGISWPIALFCCAMAGAVIGTCMK